MMQFKRRNNALFESMLTMGHFYFDGPTVYEKRKVVIVIPDWKAIIVTVVE